MGRSPRSMFLQAFWYLKGVYKKDEDKHLHGFLWRADGNSFNPKEGQFRLDSRKKFLQWGWWSTSTGCPEMVDAPSLEISKIRLDGVWATWSGWRCSYSPQSVWTGLSLKVPLNPTILWFNGSFLMLSFHQNWGKLNRIVPHLKVSPYC